MAQLIPLDPPHFATEKGGQDPRMVIAWILGEGLPSPTVWGLVVDPVGNMSIVAHGDLTSTIRYDFKEEGWFDSYDQVQQDLKDADKGRKR